MKIAAYCLKCKDNDEHSVEKILFFGKKIEIELDCGHSMVILEQQLQKNREKDKFENGEKLCLI